ncbi:MULTISPECIES: ABC transporter ATP-binding protein [unclassified Paenibacillus]|uniref:ABC transporter ATP-binding protein n=1 Tax=unclassified Paenibacillus TaxID=185978 RepID=UPI00191508EB|nr:ABC transporter ATP-binding protein [Paenibacillus sp. EPM92]
MGLLDISQLSVTFRTDLGEAKAVSDVSLTLGKGRALAILGESGSGKSVMLRTILGINRSKKTNIGGRIIFEGKELTQMGEDAYLKIRGKEIAMIFQDAMTALDPVFPIGVQLTETIRKHLKLGNKEAEHRAVQLLDQVKLPYPELRFRNYPHQLSGGMRQRVMIAMAIACGPKLLLADEPTTALDVTVQAQILRLISDLRRSSGMSMIFVTHDIGVAAQVADEIAVMYAGRIVEQGSVEAILQQPKHPYTKAMIEANVTPGKKGRLQTIGGQPPVPYRLPRGCSFAPRCSIATDACLSGVPDYYIQSSRPLQHSVRCFQMNDPSFVQAKI